MPVLTNQERLGTVIGGRYAVSRLLGEGGMGAVFEAVHKYTRRKIALKLLQPEHALNENAVARFMQEAQAATAIAHPNIVQVLDMGQDDNGALFMALELLQGEDLASRLERERQMSVNDTFEALIPVMSALAVAHSKGIVHRDLKPGNIFLARQEDGTIVPKLLDFGISKITNETSMALTGTGSVVGTPYYMAPEQARGDKKVNHQVDIWSMGVVLYECLAGRRPFVADTYNEMIIRLVTEEPPSLADAVVPPDVVAMVERALCKDRSKRYQTIDELMRDALSHLSKNDTGQYRALKDAEEITRALGTYDPPPLAQTPPPVMPDAAPPPMTGMQWERTNLALSQSASSAAQTPARRPTGPLLVGGALVLTIMLAGAALAIRSSRAPAPAATTPGASQTTLSPVPMPSPATVLQLPPVLPAPVPVGEPPALVQQDIDATTTGRRGRGGRRNLRGQHAAGTTTTPPTPAPHTTRPGPNPAANNSIIMTDFGAR